MNNENFLNFITTLGFPVFLVLIGMYIFFKFLGDLRIQNMEREIRHHEQIIMFQKSIDDFYVILTKIENRLYNIEKEEKEGVNYE